MDYLVKPVCPTFFGTKWTPSCRLREWAQQQAKWRARAIRQLVEGIEDYAIFLVDADGKVATWNKGEERLTGYRGEEILGQPYTLIRSRRCRIAPT